MRRSRVLSLLCVPLLSRGAACGRAAAPGAGPPPPTATAPTGTGPAGTGPPGTAPSGTAPPGTAPSGTAPPGAAPTGGVPGGGAVPGEGAPPNATPGSGGGTAKPSVTGGAQWKVTADWKPPTSPVTVPHPMKAPVRTPLGTDLPYLEGVYVGDHPDGKPGFSRLTFHFRGAFPEYTARYVPQVLTDGEGKKLPLEGNAALEVRFTRAQAHDNKGASTFTVRPQQRLGLRNLRSYGFAGDYEGYVTFGLGIQVAAGSGQVLPVRLGELTRSDAKGKIYVVAVDVQYG